MDLDPDDEIFNESDLDDKKSFNKIFERAKEVCDKKLLFKHHLINFF